MANPLIKDKDDTRSALKLTIKRNDHLFLETSDGVIEVIPQGTGQMPVVIRADRCVKIMTKSHKAKSDKTDEDLIAELQLLQQERLDDLKEE